MKKGRHRELCIAVCLLAAFALWTTLVRLTDVQAIGPRESAVGFATVNKAFHDLTGVHMSLYIITDWLGLVPIGVAMGFAILGLAQWIKRERLLRVDRSILALGGFYLAVIAVYVFFEMVVVNYRPVLIDGFLEASYPSSTTMLVLCVMPTAIMQFNARIINRVIRQCVAFAIVGFTAFMVVGRLVSGVHWLSDIIGGALVSSGLVMMYHAIGSPASKS